VPRFQESVIGKQSKAALSLCKWVRAMYVYSQVAKEVEPKRARLNEMNVMLEEAERKLAIKVSLSFSCGRASIIRSIIIRRIVITIIIIILN
jgi:hypothetical protein